MKHFLIALGALLGLTVPLSAHAAPAPSVDSGRSARWLIHTETTGHGANKAIYYYTNIVLTGSHIPVVIRRYKGQMEIVSGGMTQGTAYSVGDLGTAGTSDVGSALSRLDPSITTR